jgi:hypothetical protein
MPAAAAPQQVLMQVPTAAPSGLAQVSGEVVNVPTVQTSGGQVSTVTSSVQTMTPARPRLALGLEWVRIPLPFPRLYSVPGEQEIVTRTQTTNVAQPQSVSVAPPQVISTAPSFVPVAAGVSAVPQAQVSSLVAVPQVQTNVSAVVPQAAVTVPVQQPSQVVAVATAPQPCRPAASKEEVEELNRKLQQLEALEKSLNERLRGQSGASGTPEK